GPPRSPRPGRRTPADTTRKEEGPVLPCPKRRDLLASMQMNAQNRIVFSLTEEAPRMRWLTRETFNQLVVELRQGVGVDLLLFGDTASGGQPVNLPNLSAPYTYTHNPGAIFQGLAYTLLRRPGSPEGPILVLVAGMHM